MVRLKRVSAGHYTTPGFTVQNVFDGSGAPHCRNARAKWLVTPEGKPSFYVPSLARARERIDECRWSRA